MDVKDIEILQLESGKPYLLGAGSFGTVCQQHQVFFGLMTMLLTQVKLWPATPSPMLDLSSYSRLVNLTFVGDYGWCLS